MNTALTPHPRFSTSSPIVTAREIVLAAACLGLKGQLIEQAAKITALEERNRALTKALHRQASAGHAIPEVLGLIVLAGAGLAVSQWRGQAALACFALGFFLGLAWMILLLIRAKPARTTARRREHPAHLDEPMNDAQIVGAIRGRDVPLGEAYAGEVWSEEPGPWIEEPESHPEALTRQLDQAIHHPAAEAAALG